MPARFAATPEPPYYAVIFTAQRTESDDGYAAMATPCSCLQQSSGVSLALRARGGLTGSG